MPGEPGRDGGLVSRPEPGTADGRQLNSLDAAGMLPYGAAGLAVLLGFVLLIAPLRMQAARRRRAGRLLDLRDEALAQCREGIAIIRTDGHLDYVNPAFARMYAFAPEELEGAHFSMFFNDDHIRREIPGWIESLTARDFHEGPLRQKRRDGTSFPSVTTVSVVRDRKGKPAGVIALVHDSAREEHLQAQLRQAQKMEAIGRLAGGVAHDFNNLMTVIIGYSQMTLQALGADHPLSGPVREIGRAGERAADLTSQLLTFSRKQVRVPVVLNLNDLVRQSERMLRRVIGNDIEIITRLDPSLCPVKADAGQMHQVILNLAVNARDAMPRGGSLIFETSVVTVGANGPVELPRGEYARLTVADTGEGMDEEVLRQAFEPFFTTKAEGQGTGLGLSIVYGIARQSGGVVTASSEPGKGSSFDFYLPACGEAGGGAGILGNAPLRGSGSILVVEDRDDVRTVTSTLLRSYGYRVMEATGAAEAEAVCRGTAEPIHLLLADLELPNRDGKELADRILALRPGIRILYMTGHAAAEIATRFRAGEAKVLSKPFTPETLAETVAAALA